MKPRVKKADTVHLLELDMVLQQLRKRDRKPQAVDGNDYDLFKTLRPTAYRPVRSQEPSELQRYVLPPPAAGVQPPPPIDGTLQLGDVSRPMRLPPSYEENGIRRHVTFLNLLLDSKRSQVLVERLKNQDPDFARVMMPFIVAQAIYKRLELHKLNERSGPLGAALLQLIDDVILPDFDFDRVVPNTQERVNGRCIDVAAYAQDGPVMRLLMKKMRAKGQENPDSLIDALYLAAVLFQSPNFCDRSPASQEGYDAWVNQVIMLSAGANDGSMKKFHRSMAVAPPVAYRSAVLLGAGLTALGAARRLDHGFYLDYLHDFINMGWAEGVQTLVDHGADVNARKGGSWAMHPANASGETALICAAQVAQKSLWPNVRRIVDILVQAGADARVRSNFRSSTLSVVHRSTPFELALRVGHGELAQSLKKAELAQRTQIKKLALEAEIMGLFATIMQRVAAMVKSKDYDQISDLVVLILTRAQQLLLKEGDLNFTHAGRLLQILGSEAFTFFYFVCYKRNPEKFDLSAEDWAVIEKGCAGTNLYQSVKDPESYWLQIIGGILAEDEGLQGEAFWRPDPRTLVWTGNLQLGKALALKSYCLADELLQPMTSLAAVGEYGAVATFLQIKAEVEERDLRATFFLALYDNLMHSKDELHRQVFSLLLERMQEGRNAAMLIEATLSIRDLPALKAVLQFCKAHKIALEGEAGQRPQGTLLHTAVAANVACLEELTRFVGPALLAAWCEVGDESGDTPLHLAARRGMRMLRPLIKGLDRAQAHASMQKLNISQRTPALEALAHGQLEAFLRLGQGDFERQSFERALLAHRGNLSAGMLKELNRHPAMAARLLQAAPRLMRHMAKEGEREGLEALVERYPEAAARGEDGATNLLHSVAQGGFGDLLQLLRGRLEEGALRHLARAVDEKGAQPSAYATEPELQKALEELAGGAGAGAPPMRPRPRKDEGPKLLRRLKRAQGTVERERAVTGFLLYVGQQEALQQDMGLQAANELAWDVLEHLGRAPNGPGLGAHYEVHLPGQSADEMAKRALENGHRGASFFHERSGVALLRARQQVLNVFAEKALAPWETAALEVTDPALSGEGFYRASPDAELEHYTTTDRARFVLQRQGDELCILSVYPVPHRPGAKRQAA